MQGPSCPDCPDEDTSGGFPDGGWARKCCDEVMAQVMKEAMGQRPSPFHDRHGRGGDGDTGRLSRASLAADFTFLAADRPVVSVQSLSKEHRC